jgi:hypothetical protein
LYPAIRTKAGAYLRGVPFADPLYGEAPSLAAMCWTSPEKKLARGQRSCLFSSPAVTKSRKFYNFETLVMQNTLPFFYPTSLSRNTLSVLFHFHSRTHIFLSHSLSFLRHPSLPLTFTCAAVAEKTQYKSNVFLSFPLRIVYTSNLTPRFCNPTLSYSSLARPLITHRTLIFTLLRFQ